MLWKAKEKFTIFTTEHTNSYPRNEIKNVFAYGNNKILKNRLKKK
jgi:hypothetical protein